MKVDKAEPFLADDEMVKRISKALDDYREAVKARYPSPMPTCTCCPMHRWPIG